MMDDMARVDGRVLTGHNDDIVSLDGRASIGGELCTGRGDDDIRIGARAMVGDGIDAGKGNDTIRIDTGANITQVNGGKGFDTLALGADTRVELGPKDGSGTVFYQDENGADTGESFDFKSIERITCFTPGTLIITANGKTAIEDLNTGDRVWTMDNGLQPIAWIGRATVPAQGALAPIRISKGTLGNDRDLLVSPQHRMMLDGWRVEMHCGMDEVLAPAKSLSNDNTIRPVEGGTVTYIHIAFDDHQIVIAEGIPSESFFPGAEALSALDQSARAEILALFPEWACPHMRPTSARPVVSAREAKTLV